MVVGRCSETILREYESMVSIFIRGDKPQKAERIMKYYNMNEKDALGFMKEKDKRRCQKKKKTYSCIASCYYIRNTCSD